MAIKGSSLDDGREIFTPPRQAVDQNRQHKAHKYGLKPFIVGTQRAKDLLLGYDAGAGRIKLAGSGPGRMHWYRAVRPDYWEQLLSEVKAPHRTVRNKKVWQKKAGVRNEALDGEVYALHAARSLKLYLWKEERWLQEEQRIRQPDIFAEPAALPPLPAPEPDTEATPPPQQPDKPANQPVKAKPDGFFNASGKRKFSATIWK